MIRDVNMFTPTFKTSLLGRLFWPVTLSLPLVLSACGAPNTPNGANKGETVAQFPASPFAAIANGKVDVEGGIIEVAARRGGIVEDVLVQEGDTVVKGQILARQEQDTGRLAAVRAQASVNEAITAIRLTQVRLDTARREYNRYEQLQATNFVAAQKLDAQRDAVREAEATLASQQASVASAKASLAQANFDLEQTLVRAPADGRILRRFANPGSGASTLNVSTMFYLEPNEERIIRAEIVENSIPDVTVGQEVEIIPEADQTKIYTGQVKRIAATFGARRLVSDSGNEAADERVVEVVVSAGSAPFLIGQRVMVKFMKPGEKAGIVRQTAQASTENTPKPK
jgi:RND family efflux transporter MFP subunit